MSDSTDGARKPQFSLRGLLWFVAAFSAYVSMLAETARWAGSHPEDELTRPWIVTLFATWAILFLFLRSRGVRGMLVAHCAGPVVGLVFVPLQTVFRQAGPHDWLLSNFGPIVTGCFISSLISFPISVLRMVVLAVRRRA